MVDEDIKIIHGLFGEPYQATKDVRGVTVVFRTLFDYELFDCIKRANRHTEEVERFFDIDRWKLAYSIISISEKSFDVELIDDRLTADCVQKRYEIVCSWLNVYIAFLMTLYQEVVDEEIALVDALKKDSGT